MGIFCREAIQTLLDHMVSVQVLNQLDNVVLQGADHCLSLLRGRDELDHLLQSAGTMLIQRDIDKLGGGIVHEHCSLFVVRVFKQLLAQVVAKWVC